MPELQPHQFDYGLRLETGKATVEAMVGSMGRMNALVRSKTIDNPHWDPNNSLLSPKPVIFQRKHAHAIAARVTQPGPERERMADELHDHGIRHAIGLGGSGA